MVLERLLRLHDLIPGSRLDLAIEQLQGGVGFVFDDVWFRKDATTLNVEALASVSEVTQEIADQLIRHGRESLERVRAASPNFDKLAGGLTTSFAVIDDYGMGTIVVCRLVGDRVMWERSST
jgi:hypothetical protein